MITRRFNVGELRRIVKESQKNEFKPVVFGDDESKKINDKAYADITKETSKYDGGLTNNKKSKMQIVSDNKGMGDLEFDNINKPFADKVKSQMKGYVSKDAEDKHKDDEFGNATYDNDGNFYNAQKEHAEKSKWGRDKAAEITPEGDKLKDEIKKQSHTMYENKVKRLNFKKTRFLSENHMLSKIPDEFKTEGNRFIMRDGAKNEYLVEWHEIDPNIRKKPNMDIVCEETNRIKQLWGYKSAEAYTSTPSYRLQENSEFSDMVNKARKLMK